MSKKFFQALTFALTLIVLILLCALVVTQTNSAPNFAGVPCDIGTDVWEVFTGYDSTKNRFTVNFARFKYDNTVSLAGRNYICLPRGDYKWWAINAKPVKSSEYPVLWSIYARPTKNTTNYYIPLVSAPYP